MNNFDTVREALKLGGAATNAEIRQALTALDQIEAMAGEPWLDERGYTLTPLHTAAPPAQQYEAGDMASAAAQGFRDGVASVTQQPQAEPDWINGVPHWSPALVAKVKQMTAELDEPKQPQAEKRCQYCDGTGDVHSIDGQWRGECHCQKQPQAEAGRINYFPVYEFAHKHKLLYNEVCAVVRAAMSAPQQAEAVPPDVVRDADVEAAAKKMAEIFDYPWDFMPEKGRNTMRENVRAVLDAAIAQQKGANHEFRKAV